MEVVGAFEAKTHLSALLTRVENGETFVITKHGKPIARLIPDKAENEKLTVKDAISGLLEFKKSHPMNVSELKSLVEEGRKY